MLAIRPPIRRALTSGILAAPLLGLFGLYCFTRFGGGLRFRGDEEALFHAIADPRAAYAMPLFQTFAGVLAHSAPPAQMALWISLYALLLCGVFELGRRLHSSLCGWLGAFLSLALLWLEPARYAADVAVGTHAEQHFYALTLLLLANELVRAPGKATAKRNAVIGSLIGATLLVRSPLFLFPCLLAFLQWRSLSGESAARKARITAPLFVVPLILLLPWIYMNWALLGQITPFEPFRARANIITSALGITSTAEGDVLALAGLSPGQPVLPWALAEILRHPLRYGLSVLDRAMFVADSNPAMLLLAAAGFYLNRKQRSYRSLLGLSLYFLLIHCLPSIEGRYLLPLWHLLAPVGASAALFKAGSRMPRPSTWKGPLVPLGLFVGCFTASALWRAVACAAAEPGKALTAALRRYPRDAWLWSEHGIDRLLKGDVEAAVESLRRAREMTPTPRRKLEHAWALLWRGGEDRDLIHRESFEGLEPGPHLDALAGFSHLLEGRVAQAEQRLAAALGFSEAHVRGPDRERNREALERLRRRDRGRNIRQTAYLLYYWPPAERARILKGLQRTALARTSLYLELAEESTLQGNFKLALEALSYRADAPPDLPARRIQAQRDLVEAMQRAGYTAWAFQAQSRFKALDPGFQALSRKIPHPASGGPPEGRPAGAESAEAWNARGLYWARRGDMAMSIDALRRAIALRPDYLDAHVTLAGILIAQDRRQEAFSLMEGVLERSRETSSPAYRALKKDSWGPQVRRIRALQSY